MIVSRRLVFAVTIVLALVAGLLAVPWRYEVEGVSMGPGLLPGDVVSSGWLPALDRLGRPGRFERWIMTLPDGSTGLKRVIGLPGETLSITGGDVSIDGSTLLKGPRLLTETGSTVASAWQSMHEQSGAGSRLLAASPSMAGPEEDHGTTWSLPPALVLDEAAFAVGEVSRLLLPVRDVGFAAIVRVSAAEAVASRNRLRASAGPLQVTWRLRAVGRLAIVVGRLDGQAVAAAWPLPDGIAPWSDGRRCLPVAPPHSWDVARPWPTNQPSNDLRSPPLSLLVLDGDAVIERVALWRDILYRPAADGIDRWPLDANQILVLGDFPSGSRDSRHFGPLAIRALRHKLPSR